MAYSRHTARSGPKSCLGFPFRPTPSCCCSMGPAGRRHKAASRLRPNTPRHKGYPGRPCSRESSELIFAPVGNVVASCASSRSPPRLPISPGSYGSMVSMPKPLCYHHHEHPRSLACPSMPNPPQLDPVTLASRRVGAHPRPLPIGLKILSRNSSWLSAHNP